MDELKLDKKIEISLSNFIFECIIANKPSSRICLMRNKTDSKRYLLYYKFQNSTFQNEINFLTQFKHQTIINFIGYSLEKLKEIDENDFNQENSKTICLLFEYSPNGNLSNFIRDNSIDNTLKQIILIGISRAILFLHQNHYVHLDIKPGNVLLDQNLHPKLSDFNLIQYIEPDGELHFNAGTYFYLAPEIFKKIPYTEKVDIFSFALLMFVVITGKEKLYDNILSPSNFKQMILDGVRPVFERPIKPSIQKLIENCWSEDPDNRPTADDLFHKLAFDREYWLDDVDEEKIISYVKSIE